MVITSLSSVSLDLTKSNEVITLSDIAATELVTKSGEVIRLSDYGIHGYLDIGIIDTMKDLFVNLIGALVFSVIGYFYIKTRGKGKLVRKFIPTIKEAKEDR